MRLDWPVPRTHPTISRGSSAAGLMAGDILTSLPAFRYDAPMPGPGTTLLDLFEEGLRRGRPDRRLLFPVGGQYRALSSEEFSQRTKAAAAGLAARGVRAGDRVALISYNRPEWAMVDYACHHLGAVLVPLYSTLPPDQIEFILADSGARLVFAENEDQFRKLDRSRDIVTFDSVPEAISFEAFLRREAVTAPPPKPDDLATIIYTSGTTGTPKGVMLTHANLASNAAGCLAAVKFTDDDVSLSFLPLCHAFQRTVDYAIFAGGGTIAYAESIEAVVKNLQQVDPTILCSVPRVFEKFYDKVTEAIEGQPEGKRRIARWALSVGAAEAERRRRGRGKGPWLWLKHRIARALVLDGIRRKLGGRLRLFVSGGAALGARENEFFHALGFTLLEGYGLSETSPVITLNRPGRTKIGTVGLPIEGVEVRIAPEDGEILCRGPNVMKGYLNRPEETAAALQDGWFHTGDIGEIDADGFLKITDRKKDLLKTSGGKYVAPGPLENKLRTHPFVARAVVLGDGRKYAAALIVPDFSVLESRFPGLGRRELTAHGPVLDELQKHLDEVNRGLASYETVKKFALLERDFSADQGELTPTQKVRRRVVEQNFKREVESLFGPV